MAEGSESALLRRSLPAAQAGEPVAQYMMGMMQLYGSGGANKDVHSGLEWLKLAAAQGYSEADTQLGIAYLESQGVTRSPQDARRHLQSAARRGNARAQTLLAMLLDSGAEGIVKDYSLAAYWYQQAARSGRADAQHLLGLMYLDGRGVTKDPSIALKLFKQAAARDSSDAQYDVGAAYASGTGTDRDQVSALAWFLISAARGHAGAKFQIDRISRDLTKDEVKRATVLADHWRPGNEEIGISDQQDHD